MKSKNAVQVLVTGGSGFIGGWCVLAALNAGYQVRTTVRDPKKEAGLRRQLHAAATFDDDRLTVVRADLQSDDGLGRRGRGLHVRPPRRLTDLAYQRSQRRDHDHDRPRRRAANPPGGT